MRKKVLKMLPKFDIIHFFDELRILAKGSNVDSVLDDILLTSDDQTQFKKYTWMDIISENRDDDAIITFKGCMEILVSKARSFVHELLGEIYDSNIGFMWQTSTRRENFERFEYVVSMDAMKRGINKWS